MTEKTKNLLRLTFAAVLLLALAFAIGREQGKAERQHEADAQLRDRIASLASEHESTLRVVNQKVRTLEDLLSTTSGELDDKTSEVAVQAELIKKLKGDLRDVQGYVKIEKVFLPGETVTVRVPESLADRHDLIRWSNDTPVARLDISRGLLSAQACQVAFKLRQAYSKKNSSFLLFALSECDGVLRDVPLDNVEVTTIDSDKPKLFSPRLGLGVTLGASVPSAQPIFGASLYVELLHPLKNLSLLAPQLTLGSHVAGGMNLLAYNIGGPLPLVDDLWLHLGGGYGVPLMFPTGPKDKLTIGAPSGLVWLTVGTQL